MILLLGASGYLGQAFAAELRRRKLFFVPLSRGNRDYTRFSLLLDYVRATRPEFVINAAGYTGHPNVDACSLARTDTIRANTLLPQTIARVCCLTNTPWAHVLSGCIYSGAKVWRNRHFEIERDLGRPELRRSFDTAPERFHGFTESDPPNFSFDCPPCSFYSGSKALAEELLGWSDQKYLWRPRMLFDESDHPRNLLSRIQHYPKVHDTVDSLTHRGDFARACLDLWERGAPFGTYNIVNPGALTGRQIVEAIQTVLHPERRFQFWENDTLFFRHAARGPRAHCILDPSKLLSAGIAMRNVHDALRASLEQWQPQPWTTELHAAFESTPDSAEQSLEMTASPTNRTHAATQRRISS